MSEENGNTKNGEGQADKRQQTIDFILEHQAKFSVDIDRLTNNVSQLGRIVKMAVVAGRKVRSEFRESQIEIKEMREVMKEQDKRISAIIDTNLELQDLARQNLQAIGNKLDRLTDIVIAHATDTNVHSKHDKNESE